MDPLTALSLAGNVIQFVDFGSKLLSQGYELYKSTGGRLELDEELELITADLSGLINKMRHANVHGPRRIPSSTPLQDSNAQQLVFENICHEATQIAEAILVKLELLKIDDTKNRKLETFKRMWKRVWSQNEIDVLLVRLSRLKDVIDSEALAAILQNTNELTVRTLAHIDSLDQHTQRFLTSLLESNQATTHENMTTVAQFMRRLEAFNLEEHCRTREMIIQRQANDSNLQSMASITASVEILAVSQQDEKALRVDVENKILDHLAYPVMPERYESVVDAHPLTFEWAFQDSISESRRWANLATWLKTGNGLYWISGKPGSGKSTLMKHIYDDDRTRLYLNDWAHMGESTPVVIGTFFFWNSGTLEQRSQIGMLRTLLFQVLEQVPELIPVVFPSLWAKQYEKQLADKSSVWSETWTLRLLMEAFRRLIAQREIHVKLFFLIDGLDEFEGDHEVLAELFNDIVRSLNRDQNHYIKCCVSSRPWVVFKENFEGCPTLQLQDLTFNDIQKFVTEKFLANSAFKRLAVQESQATSQLIQEVVAKAEGVFLWVHIVVNDLLRGIRNRDSIPDLWRRLESLPRELEPLYRHIMSQIDPTYLIWASKVFQIVRAAHEVIIPRGLNFRMERAISLVELYFALDETLIAEAIEEMSQASLDNKCREIGYHITARCACMLEVSKTKGESEVTSTALVQYLHRTARDFLEDQGRWNEILCHTRTIFFDPYWYMMRSSGLMLRRLASRDGPPLRLQSTAIALLAFASHADAHDASHVQQVKILDDANNVVTCHRIPLVKWHASFDKRAVPQGLRTTIMACALALNISGYVAASLRNLWRHNPLAATTASTSMLRDQIRLNKLRNTNRLPDINFRMVSVLIAFGADVNYKAGDTTTWEDFLQGGIEAMSSSSDHDPNFARLMSLFLSSGANPRVSLWNFVTWPTSLTFLEFFQTYVRPKYPSEADHLHDEIMKALKSTPTVLDDDLGETVPQASPTTVNSPRFATREASNLYLTATDLKKNDFSPHITPIKLKPRRRSW
ncbi:hypothetical protein B0J14DRAFT_514181 [Halenospora varia]|nr:hypothetical protein B0J14DRAFT_514181 [Halenospora varia]